MCRNLYTAECLKEVMNYLPGRLREYLSRLPESEASRIQEIRLRNQKTAGIVIQGTEQNTGIPVSFEEMTKTFQAVCSYSVYHFEQELAEGYITIRGGCRVGICGSAVREQQNMKSLKYISSLNFRIPGEYPGIAEPLWKQCRGSVLLAGTVGSGKTTYLRDFCRIAGNHCRTALIDERGEVAAVQRGAPSHDVGRMTDIFDNYPRAAGMLIALRVMNPEYLVCDEISTPEDVQAILTAAGCGVKFAASCHAGSLDELRNRTVLRPLLEAAVFSDAVFLKDGSIQTIRRLS